MHHFDDDKTIQPEMCANIDFSHTPAGEFLFDAHVSNYLAGPRWHGRIIQQPGNVRPPLTISMLSTNSHCLLFDNRWQPGDRSFLIWLIKKSPPHPSARLRRLRTGRVNLGERNWGRSVVYLLVILT